MPRWVESPLSMMRILWVTDEHLHPGDERSKKRVSWFFDLANRVKPHLVIDTGDFIDGYMDEATQFVAMQEYIDRWQTLSPSIPYICLPGNRDVSDGVTLTEADWITAFGYENRLGNATDSKFSQTWEFTVRGTKVLIITVSTYSYGLHSPAAAQTWVQGSITNTDADMVLVVVHNDIFYNRLETAIVDSGRTELPVLYLHGHNHGGRGMRLMASSDVANLRRYLLGGLMDSGGGFCEELLIHKNRLVRHTTIRHRNWM